MSATKIFPLFGGAAQVLLPSTFEDMSDFRPVPDHQEFLYDKTTEQVVIIEILERKEEVSDAEAAKWFLEDVVVGELDLQEYQYKSGRPLQSSEMPHFDASIPKSTATARFLQTWHESQNPNPVQVQLASVRLAAQSTDLLIALYDPIEPAHEGSAASADGNGHGPALEIFRVALESFELLDLSIFGTPSEVQLAEPMA